MIIKVWNRSCVDSTHGVSIFMCLIGCLQDLFTSHSNSNRDSNNDLEDDDIDKEEDKPSEKRFGTYYL